MLAWRPIGNQNRFQYIGTRPFFLCFCLLFCGLWLIVTRLYNTLVVVFLILSTCIELFESYALFQLLNHNGPYLHKEKELDIRYLKNKLLQAKLHNLQPFLNLLKFPFCLLAVVLAHWSIVINMFEVVKNLFEKGARAFLPTASRWGILPE